MSPAKDRTSITMDPDLLQYVQERARNQHSSVSQVLTDIVLDDRNTYLIGEKRWRPEVHSSMSSAHRASQQSLNTGEQAGSHQVASVAELSRRRQLQRDHGERTGVASLLPDGDHYIQHTVADLMSREGGPSLEEGNAHREAVREEMLNEVDPDGLLRGWGREAVQETWLTNPLSLIQHAFRLRKAGKTVYTYSNPHQRAIGFICSDDNACFLIKLDALHAWKGKQLYDDEVLSMTVGGVIDTFANPEAREKVFGADPVKLGDIRHMVTPDETPEQEPPMDVSQEDLDGLFRDEEIEEGVEVMKQRGTLVEVTRKKDPVVHYSSKLAPEFEELPPLAPEDGQEDQDDDAEAH